MVGSFIPIVRLSISDEFRPLELLCLYVFNKGVTDGLAGWYVTLSK